MRMKVGFAGIGSMGSGMARNLAQAGHTLVVYNRSRGPAATLKSAVEKIAATPAEVATGVDVVISMLADDRAVEDVVLGPGGILASLPAGGVHISMSTISVDLSRRLAAAHREKRQHYIAAPVFGRPDAAAAAKLFIVAAGPSDQVERFRPLFDAMGQKTFYIGEEAPAANLFKLSGNFLITVVIESLAETFALIRKSGSDHRKFLEIMTESLFAIPIYRNYGSAIAEEKFEPAGFRLPLGFKDNRLVLAAAEEVSVPMPLASLVRDRFLAAMAEGWSESDWSAIARISYQGAGLEPALTRQEKTRSSTNG
jgi:3-hydroxyisobutyrate dehydrogenase-like beta-hydroxyacid dehydrogenase